MTPERLQEIETRATEFYSEEHTGQAPADAATSDVWELLNYIDLLHEDLALTRQERDHAKHQALEHRKARARLEYDLLARAEKDTE